jgi:hypothetical protein
MRTRKTGEEKTGQEGPALFSLCLRNSIHLARQRLSRLLVLGDEPRKYPTIRHGKNVELLILYIYNCISTALYVAYSRHVYAHAWAQLTLVKLHVAYGLIIKGCNYT